MLAPSRPLGRVPAIRRPRPLTETVGPFKGMRSTLLGSEDQSFAEWLYNCFPSDPVNGGELVVRPGRTLFPSATSPRIGEGEGTRVNQGFGVLVKGIVHYPVAIAGGRFYATTEPSANGWSEVLNATVLQAAGCVLTASDRYFFVMFNKQLVVCGPTFAFTWDGTTNGGVTKLTNAGSDFYGAPTVYAAKLFFIRSDRHSIVWSEENDATTGYEAGGFANAWGLDQTSAEPITALKGTNGALYVLRRMSVGAILGGDASTFSTTATEDAVSSTTGTRSPEGVCEAGDAIFFVDSLGRPAYFTEGSTEVVALWPDLERAFTQYLSDGRGYSTLAAPASEQASFVLSGSDTNRAVYFPALDMVFFSYRYFFSTEPQDTTNDVLIGVNATTKRVQTVWVFPTGIEGLTVVEQDDAWNLLHVDAFGFVYGVNLSAVLHSPASVVVSAWTDQNAEGLDVDVQAAVIGPRHFRSSRFELRVQRLDVDYIGWKDQAPLEVRYATPAILAAGGVASDPTQPEVILTDGLATADTDTAPALPGHAVVGLNELCRWIVFGFAWKHQQSRLRLVGWQVQAIVDGDQPGAY